MGFGELLTKLQEERALVDLHRDRLGAAGVHGFIAGLSQELVLVASVDHFRRNGYCLIELDHVSFVRWGLSGQRAWERRLRAPDPEEPSIRDLDLSDWRSAIASLESDATFTTFFRERADDCTTLTAGTFELTYDVLIGRRAAHDGGACPSFAIKVEDITRIEFGGDYEEGLSRIYS